MQTDGISFIDNVSYLIETQKQKRKKWNKKIKSALNFTFMSTVSWHGDRLKAKAEGDFAAFEEVIQIDG